MYSWLKINGKNLISILTENKTKKHSIIDLHFDKKIKHEK